MPTKMKAKATITISIASLVTSEINEILNDITELLENKYEVSAMIDLDLVDAKIIEDGN